MCKGPGVVPSDSIPTPLTPGDFGPNTWNVSSSLRQDVQAVQKAGKPVSVLNKQEGEEQRWVNRVPPPLLFLLP